MFGDGNVSPLLRQSQSLRQIIAQHFHLGVAYESAHEMESKYASEDNWGCFENIPVGSSALNSSL